MAASSTQTRSVAMSGSSIQRITAFQAVAVGPYGRSALFNDAVSVRR